MHTLQPEIHGQLQDIFLIYSYVVFFFGQLFSSQESASVVTALEGRRARTVKRTTGETPERSAEVREKPNGIFKLYPAVQILND